MKWKVDINSKTVAHNQIKTIKKEMCLIDCNKKYVEMVWKCYIYLFLNKFSIEIVDDIDGEKYI